MGAGYRLDGERIRSPISGGNILFRDWVKQFV
jgi:hypothetical protein